MTRDIATSSPRDLADELEEETTLSEGEAEALAWRKYFGRPRPKTAEELGIAKSSVDSRYTRAKQKLKKAERLLEIDDALSQEYREPAYECSECGATLGGAYALDEEGNALCWDCAPVDREEALPD